MKRTAFAGEVEIRSSSLNHCCCSSVAPGMKCEVKNWRNAGFSWPQPSSTILTSMSAASRALLGSARSRRPRA